jgi:hypothetical protein
MWSEVRELHDGGLDMSAWTEDEKNAFNQILMELH